ncbi:13169_t:CDS:2, partial [Entrophospora sp. SA101]
EKSQHNNKENIEEVKDNEKAKYQNNNKLKEKIDKEETITLTSFNTTNWQAFLSKLMSKWIVNDSLDETADIEKYVWSDHPESHETQHVILFENTAEIFPQTGIRSVIELVRVYLY